MIQEHEFSAGEGYVRIVTFELNSRANTPLGEPSFLPADSFLISRYKDGDAVHILLDAGKKSQANHLIIPYLLEQGVSKLDMAIVSHPHQDHFGGFIDILEHPEIEIGQLIYAPVDERDIQRADTDPLNYETWLQFTAAVQRKKPALREVSRKDTGSIIRIASDMYWEIIDVPQFRQEESEPVNLNNLNLVLKLNYKKFTALFPGDCAVRQSEGLMQSASAGRIPDVFMLKAAHHGGNQSMTRELIEACNARLVIVPSNYYIVENVAAFAENSHIYSLNGAKVFRTDIYNTIEIMTDGEKVRCTAGTPDYQETVFFPSC